MRQGFSTRTSRPSSINRHPISEWVTVGVATTAASDARASSSMRFKDGTSVWFGGRGGASGIDIEDPRQGRVFGG